MVPAVFVTLDKLPLTPNGKVDRRALPAPETSLAEPALDHRGPRTHAEQTVATVWRELLSVERISITDNFLDLGGHSLLIMQAIAKLEARTGKRTSPRAFIFQTLEQIAKEYDTRAPEPPKPTTPTPQPPTGRLSRWLSALIPGGKTDLHLDEVEAAVRVDVATARERISQCCSRFCQSSTSRYPRPCASATSAARL